MLVRRRYYFWLLKAYIRRWKKTIFSSVVLGAVVFFIGFIIFALYVRPVLEKKVQKIGYWGVYTAGSLPETVLSDMSYGLTKVEENGTISPAAAYKWSIDNDGKHYTFYIKKGQRFHNGKELTAQNLSSSFKDVEKKVIDSYTVSFTLKAPYSPFLATVSTPIFLPNFVGLGEYKVKKTESNAGFIQVLSLDNIKNGVRKNIHFYPTEEALKTAYALGEVDKIENIHNLMVKGSNLLDWKNTKVDKKTNYREQVVLFFNNEDESLSNKKLRQALNYALPPVFSEGERAFGPIPPNSIYFVRSPNYGITDKKIADTLLSTVEASLPAQLEIKTTHEFVSVGEQIKNAWEEIGIKTKIVTVDSFPSHFQVFLYPMKVLHDPDQYTLWHKEGSNNISHYKKNVRIDKLLEDGRLTSDINERITIYADFQKYLIDDVPASFLYYPYSYTVVRN